MLSSSRAKPFGGSRLPLETIVQKGGAAVASVTAIRIRYSRLPGRGTIPCKSGRPSLRTLRGRPGVREAQPHRLESSHERLNVVRIHEPDSEEVGVCTERLIGAVTLEPFSAAWIHGLTGVADDDHAQRFGEDAHWIIATRSRSLVLVAVAG
jgi:hypothetical protein